MHDIKYIRENPEDFDAALAKRGVEAVAQNILALDEQSRALKTQMQDGQARRNEASKAIGKAKGQGDEDAAQALMAEVAELKSKMPEIEEKEREASARLQELLAALPNLPADGVPPGEDEDDNVEVERWGQPRNFDFDPKEHSDFGPALGLDFETAATMSGSRFAFLRGQMARLQRAIGQFMLDRQTMENGFQECAPPVLVRDQAMYGTGQLPKFSEDSFQTTNGHWLI
ncbi:MAG: serine--tRNA ligase, partial [Parasphingorhabdus sp.]